MAIGCNSLWLDIYFNALSESFKIKLTTLFPSVRCSFWFLEGFNSLLYSLLLALIPLRFCHLSFSTRSESISCTQIVGTSRYVVHSVDNCSNRDRAKAKEGKSSLRFETDWAKLPHYSSFMHVVADTSVAQINFKMLSEWKLVIITSSNFQPMRHLWRHSLRNSCSIQYPVKQSSPNTRQRQYLKWWPIYIWSVKAMLSGVQFLLKSKACGRRRWKDTESMIACLCGVT